MHKHGVGYLLFGFALSPHLVLPATFRCSGNAACAVFPGINRSAVPSNSAREYTKNEDQTPNVLQLCSVSRFRQRISALPDTRGREQGTLHTCCSSIHTEDREHCPSRD